ncbi:DUF4097 family beta strand repeat-containing protein [Thermoactinospora rubra]|uniref:DUF4097 family beta strand repeat-containing protein n=1 Tax=Thermoactinospora rubra TaxID=1088767 RepID=UPI000A10A2F0|nr:DUF4097 family beta strand repeat-containing protein [Thermoactinospora rubra]
MSSRSTWRAWGAVATVLTIGIGCFIGWTVLESPPEKQEYNRQRYSLTARKLIVDAREGHGEIEVMAGRDGEVTVERAVSWDRFRPTAKESWRDGALTITLGCPPEPPGPGWVLCRADYRIRVPSDVDLEVVSDDGDVDVSGVQGDLRLFANQGNVTVSDASGDLTVRTEVGQVLAAGLRCSEVDVQGRAGDLTLAFVRVPSNVSAVILDGSIALDLPDEGVYRVNADVTSGRKRVRVPVGDVAPSTITARVARGSLLIH